MNARLLDFRKSSVRTRASRKEKPRKEPRALYVQEQVRTKAQEAEQQQKPVRTTREEANRRIRAYLARQFRQDLKAAGREWRDFALQLWSALHPDPKAKPTQPIADIRRYACALLARIGAEAFNKPPQIAQVRRDRARAERRKATAGKRNEARRMAEVTALLAQGRYPGFGPAVKRGK